MEYFSDSLFVVVSLSLLIAFPILIYVLHLKRRRQNMRIHNQAEGSLKGTKTDLAEAELALQKMPIDIRETILETHELYERYATHRGYTSTYMESLATAIRREGLDCVLNFQATLPMGVGDAVLEPQGIFELYVPRGKLNEAKVKIPNLMDSK